MSHQQEKLDRLEEGLQEYNLTLKEINELGWKYCGGDEGAGTNHLNYFRTIFNDEPKEVVEDYPGTNCICGHEIQRNFFICSKEEDEILILGSECINRFIVKKGRTCGKCGENHRNHKDNLCNRCRPKKRSWFDYY
jgi:hypothetical protein